MNNKLQSETIERLQNGVSYLEKQIEENEKI